jgi:hypothetical protein
MSNVKAGLDPLQRFVDVRGLTGLDARRTAMRAVRAWQRALIADLGGEQNISTQKRTLLEMATRTRLYIEHVDSWLMTQDSLINKRARKLFPIVQQRQALVDSLARILSQLGLERQAKPIPTLQEYLAQSEDEANEEQKPVEAVEEKS